MSDRSERLHAIRDRESRATPGPWEWIERAVHRLDLDGGVRIVDYLWGSGRSILRGIDATNATDDGARPAEVLVTGVNASFLAHAREDVPWLLAELERMEAELGCVTAAVGRIEIEWAGLVGLLDRAMKDAVSFRAEVERLRRVVAEGSR